MRYQAKYVYDRDGGDELFETNGGLGLIGAGVRMVLGFEARILADGDCGVNYSARFGEVATISFVGVCIA